jgi:hypothetical protein
VKPLELVKAPKAIILAGKMEEDLPISANLSNFVAYISL